MDPKDPAFRAALDAHLARWAGTDDTRSARELAATLGAYAAALAAVQPTFRAAMASPSWVGAAGWGAVALAALIALAGMQVRAFLVHHDLVHGSFFSSRRRNRLWAPLVGALCSTSPSVWGREHARHHRDSNNLDREQDGQTAAWTTARYAAAPRWQRAAYRVLAWRPVLFGLVPPVYFLGFMRWRARWHENAVFLGFVALLAATDRLGVFLAALVPASAFGFLVFHAQHTFPRLVRRRTAEWDFVENGLSGSSLLVLPRWPLAGRLLAWALYGVPYHHVHHLRPAMPAWKLGPCHDAGGPLFDATPRVTLGEAWSHARLALYDEQAGRLVSFAEAAPHPPAT